MSKKAPISERQALPAAFTYTQARAAGISAEHLYAYRDQGLIDQVARGLYRWADAPEIDQDLLEVAHCAPRGTLCLVPSHMVIPCQASEKPTFDIDDLKSSGLDYGDQRFEFHMMVLTEQGFIERDDGDPGFGLTKGVDGFLSWDALPLRLTTSGHQFIEALSNKDVWAAIRHDFKDASIETLKTVSFRLLEGYSRNVVNNIVNNTTNIGTAIHSPVQQAGAQSTQSQVATYSAESRADLARLVNEVSGHLHELKLDAAALQKATAQIATIQAQLGDEPNAIIIQQAGRTLRNITEGAIASLIATAIQPTVEVGG